MKPNTTTEGSPVGPETALQAPESRPPAQAENATHHQAEARTGRAADQTSQAPKRPPGLMPVSI